VARIPAFGFAVALEIAILASVLLITGQPAFSEAAPKGSRPSYIYDTAGVISPDYRRLIDLYLRGLDDATTNEIVIYTVPSFVGHGIKKDGIEIQDRNALANYIYNELPLDGKKGIGKAGKDNGVLVLMSLQRDSGGGSLRIEVGRGLEGEITDGTAGEILDRYLVPARQEYESTGSTDAFGRAFYNTVISLAAQTGYQADGTNAPIDNNNNNNSKPASGVDNTDIVTFAVFIAIFVGIVALNAKYGRRRRGGGYFLGGGYGGGYGGGWGGGGGGGFGGGGGRSGGGGAGR